MKLHYRIGWVIARAVSRVLWRYNARGSERIPADGPVIVASNHISFWDPIMVGLGCHREASFMAKEELFRNPLLARLIRAYNAIPVKRGGFGSHGLGAALDVLGAGGLLLVFPQGTRRRDGRLGDARPGIGYLAVRSGASIVPAYISGSDELTRSFLTRRPVTVAYGDPVRPRREDSKEARQSIADEVMNGIRALREDVEGGLR